MFRWRAISIVFGILVVSSVASAWLPAVVYYRPQQPSTTNTSKGKESTPVEAIGDTMRVIRALEERSLKQHEQLLEDTQALADLYNGLVQQNADRIAEITDLKKEIVSLRAELTVLKASRP